MLSEERQVSSLVSQGVAITRPFAPSSGVECDPEDAAIRVQHREQVGIRADYACLPRRSTPDLGGPARREERRSGWCTC